jgi:hypothetical protein
MKTASSILKEFGRGVKEAALLDHEADRSLPVAAPKGSRGVKEGCGALRGSGRIQVTRQLEDT